MGSGRARHLIGKGQAQNYRYEIEIDGLPAGSFTTVSGLQADHPPPRQPLPRLGDLWQHQIEPLLLAVVVSVCADGHSGTLKHQQGKRIAYQTEPFRNAWRLVLRPGVKVYRAQR